VARAGLSEDRVVIEAERIADEVGLSRLTLAALADSLGVRQPSLYKHIDGMDALQRSIAVRAKTELGDVLGRAAVGKSGDDAIRALATAYRRWALEHPGRYSATVRAPEPGDTDDEAASAAVIGIVFDVLAGYDLHGDDAVDATRALRSTLHGFIALESSRGFGLPVDIDRSFERLVDGLIVALHALATATATT
jgi:AcrR family transcriptional regulator